VKEPSALCGQAASLLTGRATRGAYQGKSRTARHSSGVVMAYWKKLTPMLFVLFAARSAAVISGAPGL
jgi:hypothetical protein